MKEFLINNSIAILAALFAMTTMIFAIMNYFSRYKRSTKLYYKPRKSFRIFSRQQHDFKWFRLQYKGNTIESDVIFISGKINSKGKDITTLNNQIILKAPKGSKWLDISISQKGKINASACVSKENEQEAVLTFDKLRRNQSFIVNAILQTSKDLSDMAVDSIHKTIKFEHIIDDTDDVKILLKSVFRIPHQQLGPLPQY